MANIIVGGGITGLYLGYKLQKQFPGYPITIVEKTSRIGGRINTTKRNDITYEIGAARYSEKHVILKELIHDLGLSDYVYENKNKKYYYVHGKIFKTEKSLLNYHKVDRFRSVKNIWNFVFLSLSKYSKDYLLYHTVNDILSEILSTGEKNVLISSFLYNTKIFYSNAYTTFTAIKNDYGIFKNKMYGLKNGIQIVLDALQDKFLKNNGRILFEHDVYKINKTCINVSHNRSNYSIKYNKLFLCITNFDLLNIQNLYNMTEKSILSKSLQSGSLMRIYAKYPVQKNKSWFSDLPKILTDNQLQFFIPVDYESGLAMVSYSTDKLADYWNQFGSKKDVTDNIQTILKSMFPDLKIPDPEWVSIHYWAKGIHYWAPKYDPDVVNTIIHKFDNIYVLGEAFSNHQSWIEGGLQMVEDLIKKNVRLSDKDINKLSLKNVSLKSIVDEKLPKISLSELKKHTSKESLWSYITDPVSKVNYVYDFTDWIDKHPGGSAHILSIGGKNATKKFYEQSAHPIDKIEKVIFPKYRIGILHI